MYIYLQFISMEGDELSINNENIDYEACTKIMRFYGYKSQNEAINFALRTVAKKSSGLEKALQLRGSGWEGDLDEMRATRKF